MRRRFTKWYVRKGYGAGLIDTDELVKLVLSCPWWVKILAIFLFSPSIYYYERKKQK